VDTIVEIVLDEAGNTVKTVKVKYLNGMTLYVGALWLTADDHKLEKTILQKIPALNDPRKTHRGLKEYVSNVILDEHRGLVPVELLDTFRSLL
jgi:hypothetical protein